MLLICVVGQCRALPGGNSGEIGVRSVNRYVVLLARRRELQSTISFTAKSVPDAAKLTLSGGLCSAIREKAVRPKEAKNTTLLTIENPLDFLSLGTELTHFGTLSPQQ